MYRALLPALLALMLFAAPTRAETQLRVSASILPVQGLVAGVMGELGEPDLILPPGASPHGYALRPSDARALSRADVIFRVGPGLEAFLDRPLANLSGGARVIDLIGTPELQVLTLRDNDDFRPHSHDHQEHEAHGHDKAHDDHEKHGHAEAHDDHEKHGHAEARLDHHIWLDPRNAIAIVRHVADVLVDADPANAAIYRRNAETTVVRLKALEQSTRTRLAPVADRPFIVFHDAYQYFENRYGLTAAGSIALNPEISPGARQIALIRSRIRDRHINCVLAEPQFNRAMVEALAHDGHVGVGLVDPVGSEAGAGLDGFIRTMEAMANDMAACLATTG